MVDLLATGKRAHQLGATGAKANALEVIEKTEDAISEQLKMHQGISCDDSRVVKDLRTRSETVAKARKWLQRELEQSS